MERAHDPFAGLSAEERAWLEHGESLWRRAHEIVKGRSDLDVGDVYHALRNQGLSPAERLRRGLSRGRLGARRG